MGIEDWNVVTRKKYGYNTKEHDLAKISILVYITNFPDSCSAKDLFQTCKAYGHVVDSYIPFKRSNQGRGLVSLGRSSHSTNSGVAKQPKVHIGSYANVASGAQGPLISPSSVLVLEDSCLVECDLSRHVMGKVKDLSSIPNLYTILTDEGFSGAKLTYKGGVPLKAWSRETFIKIGKKWGETLDLEDNSVMSFGRKPICVKTKYATSILESFKIIVKGKVYMVRAKELFTWNPVFMIHKKNDYNSDGGSAIEPLNNNDNEEEFDDEYAS
nr:hypothetical protein [Tanacetum cinerariifolium]